MGFGEKISRAFKKIRGKLIVAGILWFIITIVFVAPMGLSIAEAVRAAEEGTHNLFSSDFWATLRKVFWKQCNASTTIYN